MKLFVVVVIYKMRPEKSPTLLSLISSADKLTEGDHQLATLIWDNTPGGQNVGPVPANCRYHAAPNNPGLSVAYNAAINMAKAGRYNWLLTLDQDTALPPNFLTRLAQITRQLEHSSNIAAIVPRITGDGRSLSPFHFLGGAIPRSYGVSSSGVMKDAVFAVNSAATHRVTALCELEGYNPLFPLDISDMDLFHRIHQAGKQVFIASDLVVEHEFSLLKKHTRMKIDRYRSQLLDECAFWDQSMSALARLERLVRLLGRYCKDFSNPEAAQFRKETLGEVKRRIMTRKANRVAQWKLIASDRAERNGFIALDCQ